MDQSNPEEEVLESPGTSALEQKQQLLAHHVKMVARKLSHALFVFGSQGGLGKSRTIFRTLDEESITPVLINSHITPLALYGILFQHRDERSYSLMMWMHLLLDAPPGSAAVGAVGPSESRDLWQFPVAFGSAADVRVHFPVHFCGERDPRQE